MNATWMTAAAVFASGVLFAGVAGAQTRTEGGERPSGPMPAVTRAVELTIAAGYAQGFGNVGADVSKLTDIGTAGGAVQLGVGYRFIPELTLGVYGSGAMFGRGSAVDSSANLYGMTAGVQADWHFLPAQTFDPFVTLGTGWRGYWITATQGDTVRHGLELAKLQIGVDYRMADTVSIAPIIGADLSMFLTEQGAGATAYRNIATPEVNTFVFGGVMGRFDIPTGARATHVAARW